MLALGYSDYGVWFYISCLLYPSLVNVDVPVAQGGDWGSLVRLGGLSLRHGYACSSDDTLDIVHHRPSLRPETLQVFPLQHAIWTVRLFPHLSHAEAHSSMSSPRLRRARAPKLTTSPLIYLRSFFPSFLQADDVEGDKAKAKRAGWFRSRGRGYFDLQSTKPQTLGYSLASSPVGLLAWVYEKLHDWTDAYPWTDDEGAYRWVANTERPAFAICSLDHAVPVVLIAQT